MGKVVHCEYEFDRLSHINVLQEGFKIVDGYGGENASNLVSVAVEKGATTAIGFETNINCTLANQWTIEFLELLAEGKTVGLACEILAAKEKYKNTAFISPVICGNKNTIIK